MPGLAEGAGQATGQTEKGTTLWPAQAQGLSDSPTMACSLETLLGNSSNLVIFKGICFRRDSKRKSKHPSGPGLESVPLGADSGPSSQWQAHPSRAYHSMADLSSLGPKNTNILHEGPGSCPSRPTENPGKEA